MTPQRVVSLVPSMTETLFDLGAGDVVVGITDYCIFPPDLALPRVGGTKNPRIDEIRALAPDLVHMNMEENLRRHGEAIQSFAPIHLSEPKTVNDVLALLTELGELYDCRERATELAQAMQQQLASMPERTFTFAVPIWKNPWMWCGGDTYVSDLVARAGGTNVLADRTRYPQIALEDVLAMQPDVIFLPDEPYLFTTEDAAAIPAPRIIGPFAGHLFTWHGTRTMKGLEFLH
ncbi:MAG: helical backbone metal receptor, partial [Acidobacteriota bacterium]|nr:helical backbone metal receptor [Acidobacteriota bacterium]